MSRIVFSGTMPNDEIWSTGFWMLGSTPGSAAEANALAELAFDEWSASDGSGGMYAALTTIMNSATTWTKVQTYCYPDGGPDATYVGEYIIPSLAAGTAAGQLPNQVALVLTLRTGLSGRSFRGRMYLPATGSNLSGDGQMAQTALALLTNTWARGFSDWNAASSGKIVVVSQHRGVATLVSSVTMDSRMDIQRSRAKSEAILRNSVGVVTP